MFMHIDGTMQPGYRRANADSQNLGPYSGTKEFPVAAACVRAMLCRRPAGTIEADRRNPICCNPILPCSIYTASRRRITPTPVFRGWAESIDISGT